MAAVAKKKFVKKTEPVDTAVMKACEIFIRSTMLHLEQAGLRLSHKDEEEREDEEGNLYVCTQRGERYWDDNVCQYALMGLRDGEGIYVANKRNYRRNSKLMRDEDYGVSAKTLDDDGKPFGYLDNRRFSSAHNFAKALTEYYNERREAAVEQLAQEKQEALHKAEWEKVFPEEEEDSESLIHRVEFNGWRWRREATASVTVTDVTPEELRELRRMFPAKFREEESTPTKSRRKVKKKAARRRR